MPEFHDLMNDAEFNYHYQEWVALEEASLLSCGTIRDGHIYDDAEEEAADRHAEWVVECMDAMEARGGPRYDVYCSYDEIPY